MTQNINLITDLKIQPPSVFTSKSIVQISIAWIALLFLCYIIASGVNSNKQRTLTNLETTEKKLIEKISSYNQDVGAPTDMAKETTSPQTKTPALVKPLLLSSMNLAGFYQYLEDLAKFTPDGVWLEKLVFSELDNAIIIKGSAISASGASALLSSLDKSNRFINKKFNTLHLQKNPETNNTDFLMSSAITTNDNTKETKNEPPTYKIPASG